MPTFEASHCQTLLGQVLEGGPSNLVIVIDFDRTLTQYDALNSWDAVETWPGFSQHYRDKALDNQNKCTLHS
jgi:hypothetical protein